MPTVTAGQALLHFVGLCVFTTQPISTYQTANLPLARMAVPATSRSEVVVLLPKVGSGTMPHMPDMPATARTSASTRVRYVVPTPVPQTPVVEPHTALIAFRTRDLHVRASTGFAIEDLGRSGFSYVKLNGEHITFQANGSNQAISLGKALPHIKDVWNANSDFIPGYKPPLYSAAAAVLEIPAGTLNVCTGNTDSHSRIDTEVTLNNDGVLVIYAGPTKKITLDGNALVIIANVPLLYATGQEAANNGPHYWAYCAMEAGTVNGCVAPRSTATDPIHRCQDPTMRTADDQQELPPQVMLVSFECSNTQFP
jgi:hypothetical protein